MAKMKWMVDGCAVNGEYKTYYIGGGILMVTTCIDGYRHGEYKWYYPSGVMGIRCRYVNGILHGEYNSYAEDGDVFATMYHNGVDLGIDPRGLSDRDKLYVLMSGRLPVRGE